jgi:hypothetical protein
MAEADRVGDEEKREVPVEKALGIINELTV